MNFKHFTLIAVVTIIAGCKNNTIEITGKLLQSQNAEYLYLDELKSTELITVDSVLVSEDGSFTLKRKVEFPSFYLLKKDESNFLTMLLEPGQKINIEAYHDSLNFPLLVSGSEGTQRMAEYNKILNKTIDQIKGLREIYDRNIGNPELPSIMDRLDSLAQTYLNEINSFTRKYIDDNLTSLVSLVALYQQVAPGEYILHPEKDLSYFVKVDSSMSLLYPDYEPVVSLHEQVQQLVSDVRAQNLISPISQEGTEAPEISLPNPQGDTIRLSSTRGSVVLLDFWASWCPPCRQENPNLADAYDRYHSRGFQIFQVSLDKTREAWLKGIKDDKLERWIHVSDVRYWNSSVVPLYRIEAIPFNFLLDRQGRIIASNLRGEMLQRKLAEIFNE
ncbi:MAG: AhpC/TSA family protein [Bacteroidales bacterium]|nr:AhpC/TSA family protein [Bacteroidales bacterium]